jgi:serine/threonine-protein kinase
LFGKYRIVRQIASGGMGMVHEALYCPEGGFERPVAIKRIHPHLAEQDDLVQQFRREAQLSARLVHPNIVQVFDFGRVSDTYFLAMEFVEGMTLLTFMKRHRAHKSAMPAPVVAHIVRQVLHGLAFSHEDARGADGAPLRVIHRDLSPANVLLSSTGAVKISDFGLARALRDAVSTKTLTVAGHVGYMAPEQARGESFDARCDLFGLGVILWEMLAGTRLFLRDTQATTLLALVSDPVVPITSLRSDLTDDWNVFIDSAIAREPRARFASARSMLAALDRLCPAQATDVDLLLTALSSAELAPPSPVADPDSVTRLDSSAPLSTRPRQTESQPP